MDNTLAHEIELYPPETFRTLLEHEVNMSHRYGDSLSLVDLVVETDPDSAEAPRSAEVFMINVLNLHLRNTDIQCKKGSEFLIMMPASGVEAARTAFDRLAKLISMESHTYDRVSFKLSVFMGWHRCPMTGPCAATS